MFLSVLHEAFSVKSTPHSPRLFHQEDATDKYQFSHFNASIYWHLCVTLFNFRGRWSSEMQFDVIHLETWGGTQPYVAFSTLEYCSCFFVFGGTHTALNCLTLHKPVSVVACVKLAHGWNLSSLSCSQNAKWERVFIDMTWLCLL